MTVRQRLDDVKMVEVEITWAKKHTSNLSTRGRAFKGTKIVEQSPYDALDTQGWIVKRIQK